MLDQSPVPVNQAQTDGLMDFYEALKEVAKGKRITKEEWKGAEYGFMKDEVLCIHTKDEIHSWIISAGDMAGEDYRLV